MVYSLGWIFFYLPILLRCAPVLILTWSIPLFIQLFYLWPQLHHWWSHLFFSVAFLLRLLFFLWMGQLTADCAPIDHRLNPHLNNRARYNTLIHLAVHIVPSLQLLYEHKCLPVRQADVYVLEYVAHDADVDSVVWYWGWYQSAPLQYRLNCLFNQFAQVHYQLGRDLFWQLSGEFLDVF